jgi:hypothetical protein
VQIPRLRNGNIDNAAESDCMLYKNDNPSKYLFPRVSQELEILPTLTSQKFTVLANEFGVCITTYDSVKSAGKC